MKKTNLFRLSTLMTVALLFSACMDVPLSSNDIVNSTTYSSSHENTQSTDMDKVSHIREIIGTRVAGNSWITFYQDGSYEGENFDWGYWTYKGINGNWKFRQNEQLLELTGTHHMGSLGSLGFSTWEIYIEKQGDALFFQNKNNKSVRVMYHKAQ